MIGAQPAPPWLAKDGLLVVFGRVGLVADYS